MSARQDYTFKHFFAHYRDEEMAWEAMKEALHLKVFHQLPKNALLIEGYFWDGDRYQTTEDDRVRQ